MDQEYNKNIKILCKQHAQDLVGRILSQKDILANDSSLTDKQRFENIVKFNREVIYQEYRTLANLLIFNREGREYKSLPIFDPTKKD